MWLTKISIDRPVTITMVVLALLVLGLVSLGRLPLDLYPDIEFPWVTVVSTYSGAGPEEIETLITEPIEERVSTISGVKNVVSASAEGVSTVAVEFYIGTNLDTAVNDVREKVDAAGFELPSDMDPPVIEKFDLSSMPVVQFAVYSPRPPQELRRTVDDVVKDRMGRLASVGSVQVSGGDVREILVSADKDQLEAYGLSINDIVAALNAANLNLPSGDVEEGRREYAVRAVGEFDSPDEVREVQLRTRNGKTVCLCDVATVEDTVAERDSWTRVDGKDSVTVTVLKQSGANTVDVADAVRQELMALTGQTFDLRGYEVKDVPRKKGVLPSDITARITLDQSTFVRDAINDLREHMMLGALLAVLVVFIFLHNLRGTIIVALAIPTSIIAAFTPILFAGFTLNQMTMLALSVSVGILVDDSIVVIENIYRHLRLGEKPKDAAFKGRTEIGLAAITITLVDVVVFVPIAFMGGITGQFFRQFGITVAMVTLFSLFIAFTLTPMLSSRWYREEDVVPADEDEEEDASQGRVGKWDVAGRFFAAFERGYAKLRRFYRGRLEWALDHRLATVVLGAVALLTSIGIATGGQVMTFFLMLIASLTVIGLIGAGRGGRQAVAIAGIAGIGIVSIFQANLGFEFFPRTDQGEISVHVELPAGSSLSATDQVVRKIEDFVLDKGRLDEVDSVFATVGEGLSGAFGGGGTGAAYGGVRIVLVDKLERERSDEDIVQEIADYVKTIPGAEIRTTAYEGMGGGGEAPLQIELSGTDMSELVRIAEAIKARVEEVPGTVNTDISWDVGKPEVQAQVDRYRAADRGVTTFQVASALRTSLEGDTSAKYREGSNQYDIRVQLDEIDRSSLADVSGLMVAYNDGPVYVADVADVQLASGPTKIDRKNRQRMVAVQANLEKGYSLGNVEREVRAAIADVPTGDVSVYFGGESEIMREGFETTITALGLSVVLIYILMAALFEGYLSPFIIMMGLPMALVGAILAIVITGKTLSIVTMIGIIMLMGLVGKNSILLVDYTNTLRRQGRSIREALLEAGPVRLRPILMTSFSLIFGLLPVALATAHGGEVRSPMAVAVIGGMLLNTMLSLLVIPVLYTVFESAGMWFNDRVQAIIRGALG
ncbi:MAG: efflux RND transporter permease subunit [Armatimonadetes bacterium]|nr:efflux RND transporter permease subunit [Armatimonadota bacterium]